MTADTGIGLVHGERWGANFGLSLLQLVGREIGRSLMPSGFFFRYAGTGNIVASRNKVARMFLDSDADWLLSLDDDIGFGPDLIETLKDAAARTGSRFVTGVYRVNQDATPDGLGGFLIGTAPAVYRGDDEGLTPLHAITDWPDRFHEVQACGAGCSLIHRSVFQEIAEEFAGDVWYDPIGDVRAEDLAFSGRAQLCGIEIIADAWLPLNHLKPVWLQSGRRPEGER